MSFVHETIAPIPEGRVTWRGRISGNINSTDDPVHVILPEFDERLRWGPCKWQSRDAVSLPSDGDPCLVVFDNTREPWVVCWWPF